MSERTSIPNLGRFSIRIPEDSSELRVGSFWKRKRTPDCDTDSGRGTPIDSPVVKRLGVAADNHSLETPRKRVVRSESINSPSPSNISLSHSTSTALDDLLTSSESIVSSEPLPRGRSGKDEDSQKTLTQPSSGINSLLIDTQATRQTQDPLKIINEDTHESLVVDVNPMSYLPQDEDSTQFSSNNNLCSANFEQISSSSANHGLKRKQTKIYPKSLPYDKIMSHITFVLSGYENPRRSRLRDTALAMGAKYQPHWNRKCTHLICAFKNTPKYKEVRSSNGRVVREHWILDCSRQRQLLDWRNFKLGNYPYPDSEEEVDNDDLDCLHSSPK